MLDESLPTFYLKPSTDGKQSATILLTQYGSDAEPAYTLRHPDPSLPGSKNRYAAALYDSYNPEILFAEVLLIPEWTQPNPTAEELRLNGGVPPPPQPIQPQEFIVQLYNPDQQVLVKHHPGTWNSAAAWEFEMPQQTFRKPSTSALDRTQSDPTASDTTPKINLKWKKEGKLTKDLVCNLSGKSRNPDGTKKRNKEPDIAVAFFKHLKEITIYEPNHSRIEMEDPKGLEVVLLLSAAVIRDVYFNAMKETFNIANPPKPTPVPIGTTPRKNSSSKFTPVPTQIPPSQIPTPQYHPPPPTRHQQPHPHHPPHTSPKPPLHISTPLPPLHSPQPRPPPTDPRTQWELDAETSRLRAAVEREERDRKKADHAETKRLKAMVDAEAKAARKKKADVDKETDRLRKQYAEEARRAERNARPLLPPRADVAHMSAPAVQQRVHSHPQAYVPRPGPVMGLGMPGQGGWGQGGWVQRPGYVPQQMFGQPPGPYLQPPGGPVHASHAAFGGPVGQQPKLRSQRSSFFGLLGGGSGEGGRLMKKQSSLF